MSVPEILERKRDGHVTTPDEMKLLLSGVVDGSVPEYQVAAWLMAVLFRGMTPPETATFTKLMMESGDVLDLSDIPGVKVDKHSTGGVGDKISIPLAPLVASVGVKVPMISGRGLGHTGGTLDKLESIPGLRTDLVVREFRDVLEEVGFAIIGSSASLAPADRKLYALRDVTGTVPSIPLITGSILSKKFAAGVDALVLDVKSGSGAFLRDPEQSVALAKTLVAVSKELGKRATAFVTSMDQPLGVAVGNALEMQESIDVLRGHGPADVVDLVLALGAEMVVFAGIDADRATARARLASALADGSAMGTFVRWVSLQGGDTTVVEDPGKLPTAPVIETIAAPADGYLAGWDTREIGFAGNGLGAGRTAVGDEIDPAVGFRFPIAVGQRVARREPFAEVHARTPEDAAEAIRRITAAVRWSETPVEPRPLILDTSISTDE
jgi:pyrimidine-nucleoside phosphorylase